MAKFNLFDMWKNFKGTPQNIIEKRRDLVDLLNQDKITDAYDRLNLEDGVQSGEYRRAFVLLTQKSEKKKSNKTDPLAAKIQKLNLMRTIADGLNHNAKPKEAVTFGIDNPRTFMHVAKNISTEACFDTMADISQGIYESNKSDYAEPSSSGPISRQEFGGHISMEAARGFSRLGNVKKCKDVLAKHERTYGYPQGDFIAFIEKQDKIPENNVLVIAALQIQEGKGFSLDTREKILAVNTVDDALNVKIVQDIAAPARYSGKERKEILSQQDRRTMILINHLKGPVTEKNITSKNMARNMLLEAKGYDHTSNSCGLEHECYLREEFFDLVYDEAPQNNPVILGLFKNGREMEKFTNQYNEFLVKKDRNYAGAKKISDLVPNAEKGPEAAAARLDLSKKLFATAEESYNNHQKNGAPDANTSEMMDAAIALNTAILQDTTLPNGAKKDAAILMRDMVISQRLKGHYANKDQDKAISHLANASTQISYGQNRDDIINKCEDEFETAMKPLMRAEDALHILEDTHETKECAQKIRADIDAQWAAMKNNKIAPEEISRHQRAVLVLG